MSRGLGFILCVALVACLPDAKFKGKRDGGADDGGIDAPGLDPVTGVAASPSGAGVLVTGGDFSMMFNANANASHYPERYRYADESFLLPPSGEGCLSEQATGVAIYPADPIQGESPQVTNNTAVVSLPGPGVAQTEIRWTRSTCTSNSLTVVGTSVYTFFPDGRLNRFDQLVTTPTGMVVPADCVCQGTAPSNFIFTTFTTIDLRVLDATTPIEDTVGAIAITGVGGQVSAAADHLCVNSVAGHQLAFGFPGLVQRPRIRHTSPNGLAIVKDYFNNVAMFTTQRTDAMTTTMLVDNTPDNCQAVMNRLTAIEMAPQLAGTVDGAPITLSFDARSGMYSAVGAITGTHVVLQAPGGTTIPPGFAVSIVFSSPRTFAAYRTGATDNGGILQPVAPGNMGVVAWFRASLSGSQTIVIDANN